MTSSRAIAIAGFATAILFADGAGAQNKQACVDAFEKAQSLKQSGKLTAVRAELIVCAKPSCPTLVREECVRWMDDVTRALPSIVVAVRDESGRDVLGARVALDGTPIADPRSGTSIPLDPGAHVVRAEADGMKPLEQAFQLREGERGRSIVVVLKSETSAEQPRKLDSGRIAGFTLIGVGAVALITGIVLNRGAAGDVDDMRKPRTSGGCAPDCSEDDVDAAKQRYTFGWVFGGAGLAMAGVGAALLLSDRSSAPTATRAGLRVAPAVGGATVGWRARF